MSQDQLKSFDVQSRELNVFSHCFLEASAGTGKTFAIEHLVVRLLIETTHPLKLEEVLVVTFTRAATRELKLRIRTSIENALLQLKTKTPVFDYLKACLESQEKLQKAERCLKEALASFDRAQIFTIHGFCFRMLQEFAFEAKLSFDLADPEEGGDKIERKELFLDFFRTRFKPPSYGSSQIELLLHKEQFDIESIIQKLMRILERKTALPEASSFEKLLRTFNARIKEIASFEKEKILSDLRKLLPLYKRVDLKEAEEQLARLLSWIDKKECSESEFNSLLLQKNWFLEAFDPKNLKKRSLPPSASELHYPDAFLQLRKLLLPFVQEAKDPVQLLLRMAKECSQALSSEKKLSFEDLLHRMKEALSNEKFCEKIRKRIRALVVDEFQDTDPLQWKIFHSLFIDIPTPLSALYLVGDPKQSIYRFRGADVYTYLRAKMAVKERASLDTNFRAEKPLVDALNALFSHALSAGLPLPSQEANLAYFPVKHGGLSPLTSFQDGKGAIHFFFTQGEKGREKHFPTMSMEKEAFFPFIAQEIEQLVSSGKMRFRQCAVLVKDRFQAERLQAFLKKREIPATVARAKNLVGSKGFTLLQQLIEALIDPSKIKLLLSSSLFSLSHEEIGSYPLENLKACFVDFRTLWQEKGFSIFFADFLSFRWEGKTVLERAVQVEDLYLELRSIAKLIMEKTKNASCESVLLFLEQLKKTESDQEKILRYEEEDAVTIMTVHMSKGLEFDCVFTLALAARHSQNEELIFVRENEQERVEKLDPEEAISHLYLKELDAEKMRQLYVALTRAKKRVYVPMAFELSPSSFEPGEAAPVELFFSRESRLEMVQGTLETLKQRVEITHSLVGSSSFDAPVKKRKKQELVLTPPITPSLSKNRALLLSFSSLAQKQESEERILQEVESTEDKGPHTLPLGVETGVALHTIFEKIFKRKLHLASCKEERVLLIQQELAKGPLQEWSEVVEEIVTKTLFLSLPCHHGSVSLSELSSARMMQEMEFLFPTGKGMLKGFADLVFEVHGKYYLIDWKSNWLGTDRSAYSDANLKKAMDEHDYFLQGSIYASALERYVKLFDKRPFDELFGGAFYIFLRGEAVYHFKPERDDERFCTKTV